MKLSKQTRRERALARFRIMPYDEWLGCDPCNYPDHAPVEEYEEYLGRKGRELHSLKRRG